MKLLLYIIALIAVIISRSSQLNFLFIPAPGELSHKRSMLPTAEALSRRGNQVTMWTPVPKEEPSALSSVLTEDLMPVIQFISPNVSSLGPHFKGFDDHELFSGFWHMKGTNPLAMHYPWLMTSQICDAAIAQDYDDLIKLSNRKWDLIVYSIFSPCSIVLAKLSRAPVLVWSTAMPLAQSVRARMLPFNPSYVPQLDILPEELPLHSSVFRRLKNFVSLVGFLASEIFTDKFIIQQSLVNKFWPHFTFNEFEREAVFAVAQHPQDFDFASPALPDYLRLTEICRKPKELSSEWKAFLDDPRSNGTIVIAFGHFARWSFAPEASYRAFADALARLSSDYRIVWQCNIPDSASDRAKYPNIRRTDWMPQNDILHHPKTRLFVTHGGLKSSMESICAAVPVVSMPFFAEQYRTTALLTSRNIGVFLDKFGLTSDAIYETLTSVLTNASFAANAAKMRRIIRDKPIPAEAYNSFLLEFAARHGRKLHSFRHKGMTHLSLAQYYALDVITFLVLIFVIFCYLLCKIIYHAWRNVVGK